MSPEFELIYRYFSDIGTKNLPIGIGDDAAVINIAEGQAIHMTTATLTSATPYLKPNNPAQIARLVLSTALNRMAATGTKGSWFSLSLTIPNKEDSWLEKFAFALNEVAHVEHIYLLGGDTTRGPLCIQINLLAPTEGLVIESCGAQKGDQLFISGPIGLYAAHIPLWLDPKIYRSDPNLIHRAEYPKARNDLRDLILSTARAAVSVDRGLISALEELTTSHGLGATIYMKDLPLEPLLARHINTTGIRESILDLRGDLQLLFAAPRGKYSWENIYAYSIGSITNSGKIELEWTT